MPAFAGMTIRVWEVRLNCGQLRIDRRVAGAAGRVYTSRRIRTCDTACKRAGTTAGRWDDGHC